MLGPSELPRAANASSSSPASTTGNSGLSSGRAMDAKPLREAMGVQPGEQALCFISLGQLSRERPRKPRPDPASFVSLTD